MLLEWQRLGLWPRHAAGICLENLVKLCAGHARLNLANLKTNGCKLLREVLTGIRLGTGWRENQTKSHDAR